jgi:hypothetical protein
MSILSLIAVTNTSLQIPGLEPWDHFADAMSDLVNSHAPWLYLGLVEFFHRGSLSFR